MKLLLLTTKKVNPYNNLAIEEYLMGLCRSTFKDDPDRIYEAILFLWQNDNTVVIGRNQNAWAEAKTELLEEEGGFLARRGTGGGAVSHDLGNLNFSLILPEDKFDLDKTFNYILDLVRSLGIDAERSGRNDILVDGKKFSGNAFRKLDGVGLHHGTLLVDSDYGRVGRYLTVSSEKLKSKAVTSVRSRITNLKAVKEDLTIDAIIEKALELFPGFFAPQAEVDRLDDDSFPVKERLKALEARYASWEWRYGRTFAFSTQLKHRLDWGLIDLQLEVADGVVQRAALYADALDSDYITAQPAHLEGLRFNSMELAEAILAGADSETNYGVSRKKMAEDLADLIRAEGW
ncbi:MAG TPA: lipoate--protein ligase [Fastidiosipila sp.]|nr:lipoate--protein ligase [Fastidiosipila sp.]